MENINKVFNIAKEKLLWDKTKNWSKGSVTYFDSLIDELEEIKVELDKGTKAHLEDELGDVLWCYFNILNNLEYENKIDTKAVFSRCAKKYEERVTGIKENKNWSDIKEKQKLELKTEEDSLKK
ncbi:MAG: MazG nucleotide pyrophosphohydrolase domain-containing protein [archaeon]|jgi:NTP pyrophosphatase (non-canonical NTP hydrolase)